MAHFLKVKKAVRDDGVRLLGTWTAKDARLKRRLAKRDKGLECPIVFIPDVSSDVKNHTTKDLILDPEIGVAFKLEGDGPDRDEPSIFTLLKKRRTDREFDESTRVLYVAMTRAEDKVVISATKEKVMRLTCFASGSMPRVWKINRYHISASSPTRRPR